LRLPGQGSIYVFLGDVLDLLAGLTCRHGSSFGFDMKTDTSIVAVLASLRATRYVVCPVDIATEGVVRRRRQLSYVSGFGRCDDRGHVATV
jgi:hypothetical protein